jgi:hypothetical protein
MAPPFHLWNLISSLAIIMLVIAVITAAVFAYEHNTNPRLIPCPPCYLDCEEVNKLAGTEDCPTNPTTAAEARCTYSYLNFPQYGGPFYISPITVSNSNKILFGNSVSSNTMSLGEYTDTNSRFTYDGTYLMNEMNYLTVDPSVTFNNLPEFPNGGVAVRLSSSQTTSVTLKNGRIEAKLGNDLYYLGWSVVGTEVLIIATSGFNSENNIYFMNNLFRTVLVPSGL